MNYLITKKQFVFDMVDEIVNVARAVHYEISYLNHVSKSDVISESSFKYPAVEWLERKGNGEFVLFEKAHPVFLSRKYDIRWGRESSPSYLEMKYVKKDTAGKTEQQRYFNDLLRLAHILLFNQKARAFFLACGEIENWTPCFQYLGMKAPIGNVPVVPYREGGKAEAKAVEGVYSQWFSFDSSDSCRTIDSDQYKDFYTAFMEEYKFRNKSLNHLDRIEFKTSLEWISEINSLYSPCVTAAWEITL